MVFVKVRETYDLHTVKNKMTVIGIHTPKPDIIKANFPGLLMQCKGYRPASCDVRIACASTLPLDPQGVGLAEGDVAPEDLFNPILYKACSNFGMSQIDAFINATKSTLPSTSNGVDGDSAMVRVDDVTSETDEFPIYYGLLSNAHDYRHANPQSGLEMRDLRPLVYELLYNIGDNGVTQYGGEGTPSSPGVSGSKTTYAASGIRGNAKPLPMINCTSYSNGERGNPFEADVLNPVLPGNHEIDVPWVNVIVGAIIIPPSRLHELFYRMVVEWTIEFSAIRPISEISSWSGLGKVAELTHYQNYSYEATKEALTGDKSTVFESDQCMVAANVPVNKVM